MKAKFFPRDFFKISLLSLGSLSKWEEAPLSFSEEEK